MKIPFSRTIKFWYRAKTLKFKGWSFSEFRRRMLARELDDWKFYYLPIDVSGLTVLDVGAGEGETAWFFLAHGAKKVICIEPDSKCFPYLLANAEHNPITPIRRTFQLSDLKLPFDFMKMDIEGYEEVLLSGEVTKPCVLEVHGLPLRDRFLEQGYKITSKDPNVDAHGRCYAYKNIPKKT